jgi:tripartite-type tricarboxylate transporter receptor subunit TctC
MPDRPDLRRRSIIAWAVSTSPLGIGAALAESPDPARPVKLLVPFAAGGGADSVARLLAPPLGKSLRASVWVENKPGAAGLIGLESVARAAPDGSTLALTAGSTLVISPHVTPAPAFDANRELRGVAQVGVTSLLLVVKRSHPASSLRAFVETTKAQPGKTAFGSYGIGTLSHLMGEALNQAAGIDMTHVPFGGAAPAVSALLGGHVTAVIADVGSLHGHLGPQGQLRALAATSHQRLPMLEGVATFRDQGWSQLDGLDGWLGLLAPRGTPDELIESMAQAAAEALRDEAVRSSLAAVGYTATGVPGAAFDALIKAESARWGAVIKGMGGLRRD